MAMRNEDGDGDGVGDGAEGIKYIQSKFRHQAYA